MIKHILKPAIILLVLFSCAPKNDGQFERDLKSINLKTGEIALCGSQDDKFGSVDFSISCSENVRNDFNTATALLHSFEYVEAEKMFARVIDADPKCVMAYWGVAMSNFHTLWALQDNLDLEKGHKTVALARLLDKPSQRESDYLEAIGAFYDDWDKLDHRARSLKFEKAMEGVYQKYPTDKEAAIFYALSLNGTADPKDKTFANQKKAGDILSKIYPDEPNHPGVAHYIIHNYDYPELAPLALPAAKAYAAIAPASAHALHMPSHIFTRLGLWEESVSSNSNSIAAAKCYASNLQMTGHWDEELHGMDYLVYAYLQQGRDDKAKEQVVLLESFDDPSANNGKSAYVFAAAPARYAVERKQWIDAAQLAEHPANFPWEKFPWERSIPHFVKLLGYVHTDQLDAARKELELLKSFNLKLTEAKEMYKANQVQIQVHAGEAWIRFGEKKKKEALELMTLAAEMEDATSKSPVTPGEIIPARELLGDMLMEIGESDKALEAYELDLARHPNRFNALYGAAAAAQKVNDNGKAKNYYQQLLAVAIPDNTKRPEITAAVAFVKGH